MTRLVTCGWETGDPLEIPISVQGAAGGSVVTTNPVPRTPSVYCLQLPAQSYRFVALPSAQTDLWVRASVYPHVGSGGPANIIGFIDNAAGSHGTVALNWADLLIHVYNGVFTVDLGNSGTPISLDTWHTIDVHYQLNSVSSGNCEVWVDEVQRINLVNVDLTALSITAISQIQIGTSQNITGAYYAYDDFAVNNTVGPYNNGRIGEGRVVLLRPTGPGDVTQFIRGGTNTGANWSQVNEIPASMSQYVSGAAPGQRDLYTIPDLPAGFWNVNVAEALWTGQSTPVGSGSLAPTISRGASVIEGNSVLLSTTPSTNRQIFDTDPTTNVPWTSIGVNAAQIGATVH